MSINKKTFRTGGAANFIAGSFKYDGNATGSNTVDNTITTGFEPDLLWIFPRDNNSTNSKKIFIIDRAFSGSTQTYHISGAGTMDTTRQNNDIITWNSDGFTLHARNNYTTTNSPHNTFNDEDSVYCGLAFKTTTSGTTNNDGNTTSTVFVNSDGAFSKVQFTSAGGSTTIGHGLGVKPEVMFCIRTDLDVASSTNFGDSRGSGNIFRPNDNVFRGSQGFSGGAFDRPFDSSTSMSADTSVINCTSSTNQGGNSGVDYVVYAFAPKSGFFDNNDYLGNGSSSGRTLLSCDFAPLVGFLPTENKQFLFHPDRRNAGTPGASNIDFDGTNSSDGETGALELKDMQFNQFPSGGSLSLEFSNQRVRLSSNDSSVNGNGSRYGFFAFGGDMFNVA